jgi:hypothetical protein
MDTLLIPLEGSNTISIGIFIKSGSRAEKSAYGVAHFLEHMSFKGTTKRSSTDLMIELDSIGANYNAMTGHEFTLYYVSGDPRDTEKIMDIITDLYLDPLYPDEDIMKEIEVVLEEYRMNEDNIHKVLSQKMYKNLYDGTNNSLQRPIIGYKETIEKINRSDIINYRTANYMGSNCLLCVSGNFKKETIISLIEKKFYSKLLDFIPENQIFEKNMHKTFNLQHLTDINKNISKYIHIDRDINQTVIYIMFGAYSTFNKASNAVDILCDILSNGFSSRFFNLLRNIMGVSYYNNSFLRSYSDTGHLITNVGVDHKSVVKTIKALLNEFNIIKKNGITDIELAKAKKQAETSLLFQFKDPYEYMMFYGMNYLQKKPLYSISDILNEINNVSIKDMNNVIKNIINENNIIIGTIGHVEITEKSEIEKIINDF